MEVPAVSLQELKGPPSESSADIARRVLEARLRQRERFGERCATPTNAAMAPEQLRRHATLDDAARQLMDSAFERLKLSARAVTRILKVARTVADLAGSKTIGAAHVAESIQYRSLDRRLDRY